MTTKLFNHLFKITIAIFFFYSTLLYSSEKKKPKNIIFIFSDDHALKAISAYSDFFKDIAPTPHIDSIAKEGALFTNSFNGNSICGPSRASILTGKHSHKNGFLRNTAKGFNQSQWTFIKEIKKANYQTAVIGKWHLKTHPTGFDFWEILPGQGSYYNPDFIQMNKKRKRFNGYATDIITDKSLDWLKKRDKKKPFFLMMQHKAPHRTFSPALKYLGAFDNIKLPEPKTLFDDYKNRSTTLSQNEMEIGNHMFWQHDLKVRKEEIKKLNLHSATFRKLGGTPEYRRMTKKQKQKWNAHFCPLNNKFLLKYKRGQLTKKDILRWKYQRYMKNYLATIKSVDESVGRILKYLKKNNLEKDTVVIYSSDQGFYLGEHGWYDKRWMFEESLKMPFIIKYPGVVKPNSKPAAMIQNIDYASTFLDIAGLKPPKEVQGKSILPILKGKVSKIRDKIYYAYYEVGIHNVPQHFGIRNSHYKLFYIPSTDEWQMFDLRKDPYEMKSVYNQSGYKQIQNRLYKDYLSLREYYDCPPY